MKFRKTVLILLLVFGVVISAQAAPAFSEYEPVPLTPEQVTEDIAILRDALENIHPGYDRFATEEELAAQWSTLDAAAADGSTDVDLYRDVSLLLATLRCDHTKAEYPEDIAFHREFRSSFMPFRFRLIEGEMVVWSVDEDVVGLERGMIVRSINGVPVTEILTTLEAAVSVDGFTDYVKYREIENSGDFNSSAFEQFYPVFYGFPETYEIEAESIDTGEMTSVSLEPIRFSRWQRLEFTTGLRTDFADAVQLSYLDDNTAVLTVDTFVNYRRPVNPESVYQPLFAEMNARGVEHLILDLRNTGGGSDDAATSTG